MQNELVLLEELQVVDLKVWEYRTELEAIPKGIEEMRTDVNRVREILERENTRLMEAEQWKSDREKEIVLHNELLSKSKAKLMSARNERENKAAQREIDSVRKTIQEREEEALKIMEAIEQYRVAINEHTKEFAELEQLLNASEDEGRARMAEVKIKIDETESHRRELVQQISRKVLNLYERIHRRLGRAVVEAIDGHCAGCNMELPPQMYNELHRGDSIYQCPSCFRLLVYKGKTNTPEIESERVESER